MVLHISRILPYVRLSSFRSARLLGRSSSRFLRIVRAFLWLFRGPAPLVWLGILPGCRIGWSGSGGGVRASKSHASHDFRTAGGLHDLLPYLANLQLQAQLVGKRVGVASLEGSCGLRCNGKIKYACWVPGFFSVVVMLASMNSIDSAASDTHKKRYL